MRPLTHGSRPIGAVVVGVCLRAVDAAARLVVVAGDLLTRCSARG